MKDILFSLKTISLHPYRNAIKKITVLTQNIISITATPKLKIYNMTLLIIFIVYLSKLLGF